MKYEHEPVSIDPSKANISEADVEEWLFRNPGVVDTDIWLGRQVKVPSGIIDLLGVRKSEYGSISINVVEIKRGEIEAGALAQVSRYAFDIEQVWGEVELTKDICGDSPVYVRRVVVGESIGTRAFREAEALRVTVYTFTLFLSLHIGRQNWVKEFSEERDAQYLSMVDDSWVRFVLEQLPEVSSKAEFATDG